MSQLRDHNEQNQQKSPSSFDLIAFPTLLSLLVISGDRAVEFVVIENQK